MVDITALGELLIDFTECGMSGNGMHLFEQNPGGAPANVLAAAAKAGHRTAFIGKVGSDMHGVFLMQTLQDAGIDTSGLILADDVFTTLAFVALSPSGERTFSFSRKPGADTWLRADEVNEDIIKNTKILHIGSLSLTDEPARGATYHAVTLAKKSGALISYDPNYRASLWPDAESAKAQMRAMLPYVDLLKLSDEETALLTDVSDPAEAALHLYRMGIPCVAVTLGSRGALVCVRGKTAAVPAYPVPVADTTGAGDAFWGGFLHMLLRSGKPPDILTLDDAVSFARWGNAAAAFCVTKRGAIHAMPSPGDITALLGRS
jgi:fructokinase